jgi:hypothetical protein
MTAKTLTPARHLARLRRNARPVSQKRARLGKDDLTWIEKCFMQLKVDCACYTMRGERTRPKESLDAETGKENDAAESHREARELSRRGLGGGGTGSFCQALNGGRRRGARRR